MRPTSPTHSNQATYHAALHKHVATPHDKHSPLYQPDLWLRHDIYDKQLSYASNNVVTRSQTAFNRIDIGAPQMELFGKAKRHHPHNLPHLMLTMKDGMYGAVPRTIVTRSMNDHLELNPTLIKTLRAYESFEPFPSMPPQIEAKKVATMLGSAKEVLSEDEEDMEEDSLAVKPPPVRVSSSGASCMTCVKKQQDIEPDGAYLPSGETKKASLAIDGPFKPSWTSPFFSPAYPMSPSLESFPKNLKRPSTCLSPHVFRSGSNKRSRESVQSGHDVPAFPWMTTGKNPFVSSNCSAESVRSRQGMRCARYFPSMSSLGSIGRRSPSPKSQAASMLLENRMQNLSMGPKTVTLQRLQV